MLVPTIANRIITKDCKVYGRSSLAWLDLRFEEANLSTTIVNTGEALISAQTVSGQKIVHTDSKYGLGCWDCGSAGEYATFTIPTPFRPTFGNFRIDFFVKITTFTTGAARSIFRATYYRGGSSQLIHIYSEYFSGHKISINVPGASIVYINSPSATQWYKISLVFTYSSNITIYVDDVLQATSSSIPDSSIFHETTELRFGAGEAGAGRQFYIDNFKIIKI